MAELDKASRYQAKQDPPGFFAWLWRHAATPLVFTRWLDARRLARPPEGDLTCDTVAAFRLADETEETRALVVEFMAAARSETLDQVLAYVARLWAEKPPEGAETVPEYVGGVIINLTGAAQSRVHAVTFPGVPECAWQFCVLQRTLRDEDAATTLADIVAGRTTPWILPWIPPMHGGDEPSNMELWKQAVLAEPDEQVRATLVAFVLLFAELAKCLDPWKRALEGWNVTKSQVVEEWRQEARIETLREVLLDLLEGRFGTVPEDLQERIKAMTDMARLKAAPRQAASIQSLDELQL